MADAGEGSARPQAGQILRRVLEDAEEEIGRPSSALAFSGLAAGMTMGFSGLGVAIAQHVLGTGEWQRFVSFGLYPIGFVAVIIGRAQLFTENTLYPVARVLDRRSGYLDTLRLWGVVFGANIVGVLAFAALMTRLHTLSRGEEAQLVHLGENAVSRSFPHVFWSAVIGGWLIALIAWLIEGAAEPVGQIVLIWTLSFVVGVGGFAHCIATSGEILGAVLDGGVGVGNYARWLTAATLGNMAGGVLIVALLNYGQVMAGRGTRESGRSG